MLQSMDGAAKSWTHLSNQTELIDKESEVQRNRVTCWKESK